MNPMKYKFTITGKRALSICMACTFVGMWLGIIFIGKRYDPGVFTSFHHITLGVLFVAFIVTALLAWLTRP